MSDNKRIAKNTMALYFRMIVTILISLYTSRVILEKLGVDDFGIYQAVGGIVGFLAFLNTAISTGSSRFLTFELGTGNFVKLKRTFSSLLTAHILLALIIVFIAETAGLWLLYHKMVIPSERMTAALVTFHLSIATAFLTLTQVPYNATIIAHEKMNVYAYVAIFEAAAKLVVCYLITIGNADRLIEYSILIFLVHVSIILFYRFYCVRHYPETHYKFGLDKEILKPVLSFSGWSLFANFARAFANQGILILLNLFFAPSVVSARAISLQVNSAANHFLSNFRTAVNPQIVKLYAANDVEGSKRLLLQSTKFSYYLMLVISLPIIFLADPLLHLWLDDNVPAYTTIFLQLVIIQNLFHVFDTSFYTALYAKGQLRENALISPTILFLAFPIVYILFKNGYSPLSLSWAYMIVFAVLGLVVKPILITKICNYKWAEIFSVFIPCLFVSIASVVLSLVVDYYIDSTTLWGFGLEAATILLLGVVVAYILGLNKSMRKQLNSMISKKLHLSIKKS